MLYERDLFTMYQQWACGQNARARWLDFVEMVAKQNSVSADQVMRELQKYRWFEWGDK